MALFPHSGLGGVMLTCDKYAAQLIRGPVTPEGSNPHQKGTPRNGRHHGDSPLATRSTGETAPSKSSHTILGLLQCRVSMSALRYLKVRQQNLAVNSCGACWSLAFANFVNQVSFFNDDTPQLLSGDKHDISVASGFRCRSSLQKSANLMLVGWTEQFFTFCSGVKPKFIGPAFTWSQE